MLHPSVYVCLSAWLSVRLSILPGFVYPDFGGFRQLAVPPLVTAAASLRCAFADIGCVVFLWGYVDVSEFKRKFHTFVNINSRNVHLRTSLELKRTRINTWASSPDQTSYLFFLEKCHWYLGGLRDLGDHDFVDRFVDRFWSHEKLRPVLGVMKFLEQFWGLWIFLDQFLGSLMVKLDNLAKNLTFGYFTLIYANYA